MRKNKVERTKNENVTSLVTVKAVVDELEPFTLDFIGSSETVDRYGDIVKSDSWILDHYLKNPVFLWGHNHHQLPVGKAIDVRVNKDESRLEFKIKFAVEESPFAAMVYKFYKNGFLNATSVGFRPHSVEYDKDLDAYVLSENELYELSAVTVPANPDALQLSVSKGLFTQTEVNEMERLGMINENSTIKEELENVEGAVPIPNLEEVTTLEGDEDTNTSVENPETDTLINDSSINSVDTVTTFTYSIPDGYVTTKDLESLKTELLNEVKKLTQLLEALKIGTEASNDDEVNSGDTHTENTDPNDQTNLELTFDEVEEPQLISVELLNELWKREQ